MIQNALEFPKPNHKPATTRLYLFSTSSPHKNHHYGNKPYSGSFSFRHNKQPNNVTNFPKTSKDCDGLFSTFLETSEDCQSSIMKHSLNSNHKDFPRWRLISWHPKMILQLVGLVEYFSVVISIHVAQ